MWLNVMQRATKVLLHPAVVTHSGTAVLADSCLHRIQLYVFVVHADWYLFCTRYVCVPFENLQR